MGGQLPFVGEEGISLWFANNVERVKVCGNTKKKHKKTIRLFLRLSFCFVSFCFCNTGVCGNNCDVLNDK